MSKKLVSRISAKRVSIVVDAVEALESRRMLSAAGVKKIAPIITYRPAIQSWPKVNGQWQKASARIARSGVAHTNYVETLPPGQNKPSAVGSATPVGMTAAQVRQAYGLNSLTFNGITGDGTGQTIAVVVAYDHPGFVSSTDVNYVNSDLHQFSVAMGLPDPPSFTKVDQNGGTSYPGTNSVWAAETALDVEWAHAMAPNASIVLVEAASAFNADLIGTAVNYARTIPGVSVVSMSFGISGGSNGESFYDQYFTTPAGHAGVTFVGASGDSGAVLPANGGASSTATGNYPAESPNVVAVGGTNLTVDGNGNYQSESAWIGSGGGISNYEPKPAFQASVTLGGTKRTIPDVAMLANPSVAVYDSFNNTSGGGWGTGTFGGTSLAAPLWAGLVAVTNQGRAINGQAALDGPTQTLQRLYQLPASVLHDVTTGNNKFDGTHGYNAGPGYDLVTGRGSPVANTLAVSLAGGTYSGRTFVDNNGNGLLDGSDAVLSGVTVFNDANNNGTLDAGETSVVSAANGTYTLDLVGSIGYAIREVPPADYASSTPAFTGTTAYGAFGGFDLGNYPTIFAAPTNGTNTFTVRLNAAGNTVQVFLNTPTNGTPTWQFAKGSAADFTLSGNGGDDTFVIDLTNGNPIPAGGAQFSGAGQATGDRVTVVAASSGSAATFGSNGSIIVGGVTASVSGIEKYTFTGGAGNDTMNLVSGLTSSPTFTGGGGADTVTVASTSYAPSTDLSTGGSTITLTASGTAALTFASSQHLNILNLQNTATVVMPGTGKVLRVATLSMPTATKIDLAGNSMVINYTGATPASTILGLLTTGYAAGAWTGGGIRSSSAAADTNRRYALGLGEASTVLGLSGTQTGTFMGETVDSTALLIRYTLYGDATLNGTVDFSDFLMLQSNFGVTTTSFANADFNYDGKADFNDFLLLQAQFGATA